MLMRQSRHIRMQRAWLVPDRLSMSANYPVAYGERGALRKLFLREHLSRISKGEARAD